MKVIIDKKEEVGPEISALDRKATVSGTSSSEGVNLIVFRSGEGCGGTSTVESKEKLSAPSSSEVPNLVVNQSEDGCGGSTTLDGKVKVNRLSYSEVLEDKANGSEDGCGGSSTLDKKGKDSGSSNSEGLKVVVNPSQRPRWKSETFSDPLPYGIRKKPAGVTVGRREDNKGNAYLEGRCELDSL